MENIVAAVSTWHNCYVYELYVSPGMKHCSRIRTFNGEHLSRGWPVFLIVRMSLKWVGIMGRYMRRRCIHRATVRIWKKRKRSIKSRARYHTLSARFLRTRLQQKIVLPDADRAADSYYANREVIVVSYTRLESPGRSTCDISTRFAGYINMTAPGVQRAERVS